MSIKMGGCFYYRGKEQCKFWNYNRNYCVLPHNLNSALEEAMKFHQGMTKYYKSTPEKRFTLEYTLKMRQSV